MTNVGALVLSSPQPERVVEFYRGLGIPLAEVDHGDGIVHWACELDRVHFAVFRTDDAGTAPGYHAAGSTFIGFVVASVSDAVAHARSEEATVVHDSTEMSWGLRAVIRDPDGCPVEVFEPRRVT